MLDFTTSNDFICVFSCFFKVRFGLIRVNEYPAGLEIGPALYYNSNLEYPSMTIRSTPYRVAARSKI